MNARLSLLAVAALAVGLGGCRGMTSEAPPMHPNLNMDYVQRYEAQEANPLFADGAAQRQPVAGTIARGGLRTEGNAPFHFGRTADGAYVEDIPIEVTAALIERGEERYNIFCTVCHGLAGDGRGIAFQPEVTGLGGEADIRRAGVVTGARGIEGVDRRQRSVVARTAVIAMD